MTEYHALIRVLDIRRGQYRELDVHPEGFTAEAQADHAVRKAVFRWKREYGVSISGRVVVKHTGYSHEQIEREYQRRLREYYENKS